MIEDKYRHFQLGKELYEQDKHEEACNELQQAIDIDSNYVEAHHGLGQSLFGLKDYNKAIEKFKKYRHRS